jgi:hypothetical protein
MQRLITNGTNSYLFNGHGDIIALTDEHGSVLKDYTSDPYDNVMNENYETLGKIWDAEAEA